MTEEKRLAYLERRVRHLPVAIATAEARVVRLRAEAARLGLRDLANPNTGVSA